jgi:sugar phosphate isomerase/epimerase
MKKFPIAIQLYSVRDEMEADFYGTIKKVKELGYDGVEFAGLFGKSGKEVKDICTEIGITPISAHVPFDQMMADPDGVLSTYAEIGCEFVVIPYLTEEYRPGNEKFNDVIEGAKLLGAKAKALGMKLCYHNHDFEFLKLDGEYALDILYREVSADLLQTELDTCWVNVGGEDPCKYIEKYKSRAPIVHLKDFVGSNDKKAYSYKDAEKDSIPTFELTALGEGVLDIPGVIDAAEKSGTYWLVYEQDSPNGGRSTLECAQRSIEYYESLFKVVEE